ncbi:MAG: hypothetical protein IKI00_01555, partial [Bacteroidales bacterium]|nr:hypothetical protein [Bacteroidales bacterium]
MKTRIIVSVLAVAAICAAAITSQAFMKTDKNPTKDAEGHVLTSQWKAYNAALKADQPKKMAEILESIKKEAKARRYHWDFYDAAVKKVEAESMRNWKLHQELQDKLSAEIEEYGEPIVSYAYRRNTEGGRLTDYVLTNRARLEAGKNAPFRTMTLGQMNNLLNSFIKNDYEYALWAERLYSWNDSKVVAALKDCLGDSYPSAAWLEFLEVERTEWAARKEAAQAFAKKYEGKAVSLFAKSLLFDQRKMELEADNAGEDAFKTLYSEIKEAEKERRSYTSGVDSRIASTINDFKYQMESLERKDISISFIDKEIVLAFRNLDKADVSMVTDTKDAKTILRRTVLNPKRSFYVLDTVKLAIPRCDDGDYVVKAVNGKVMDEAIYSPKTLSIAIREDSEGWKFYVADYLTGRPCEKVDLKLNLSGNTVAETGGVVVDGFTPLPEKIVKALGKDAYYSLEAS